MSVRAPRRINYFICIRGLHKTNSPFQCRQLGIVNLASRTAALFRFQLSHPYNHRSTSTDLPQEFLLPLLSTFAQLCNQRRSYIAFQGGDIIDELLMHANAHFRFNMEYYGAPKFKDIFNKQPFQNIARIFSTYNITSTTYSKQLIQLPNHNRCPLTKAIYFSSWIRHQFGHFVPFPLLRAPTAA